MWLGAALTFLNRQCGPRDFIWNLETKLPLLLLRYIYYMAADWHVQTTILPVKQAKIENTPLKGRQNFTDATSLSAQKAHSDAPQ